MQVDFKTGVVVVFAGCILVMGFLILRNISDESRSRWREHLGNHVLQIVGLTFILPVVMVVSVAINLESQAITALLGAIIGSIFGSAAAAGSGSSVVKPLASAVASLEEKSADMKNEVREASAKSDRRITELLEILALQAQADREKVDTTTPAAGAAPRT